MCVCAFECVVNFEYLCTRALACVRWMGNERHRNRKGFDQVKAKDYKKKGPARHASGTTRDMCARRRRLVLQC